MNHHRRIAPPPAIRSFIEARLNEGLEVWLIGSRANPTGEPPNDWDFLIFGSSQLLDDLSHEPEIDALDPLIVYDGDTFESPWPRRLDGATKSGSLGSWEWTRRSEHEATYVGTKARVDETCESRNLKAVKVTRDWLA